MATNFFTQLPGFLKFPFGVPKKDQSVPSPSTAAAGVYRPRRSISEGQRPRLENQMSMSLINRGLLNPTGENNCFLNSAVQILWHIDVFRRSFRSIDGHTCVEKACIFCALKDLFTEFQHGGQTAIPPDTLRRAMADCYEEQHRFQLGLMDDAAECFEKILEQIHFHLTGNEDMDTCSVKHCLSHQKFAMTILERTECICGAISEPLSFVQFVHYVSSTAIVKEAQKYSKMHNLSPSPPPSPPPTSAEGQSSDTTTNLESKDTPTSAVGVPEGQGSRKRLYSASQVHFGKILNLASSFGEYRRCPEYERCKNTVAVKRILLNCPDIVCLGMIWDSNQPSVADIMSVVLSIGLTLELRELFDHVFADNAQFNQYKLTALIAYYGRHYSTFCYHSKMHEWIYFDDAKFRSVGSEWEDVCEEIRKAHYQPLLLVYTNPFGEGIDLSEAPKVVTKVQTNHHDDDKAMPPLSTISEEPTKPDNAESALLDAQKSGKGEKKEEEDVTSATESAKSGQVQNSKFGSIDPMTLSLIPFSRGAGTGTKSTSPVVGYNQASATPTSQGNTPTSAQKLLGSPGHGGSSVSGHNRSSGPGISGHGGSSGPGISGHGGSSGPGISGHNRSSGPGISGHGGSSGPGISGHNRSSGPGISGHGGSSGPGISSSGPDISGHNRSSGPGISGHGGSSGPGISVSSSDAGDLMSFSIAGNGLARHGPPHITTAQDGRYLPTTKNGGDGDGGGGDLIEFSLTSSHLSKFQGGGGGPTLRPIWDHYSDQHTKPSGGAPQKRLSTPTEVGGVSAGHPGNNWSKQKQENKETKNVWTVVTKVDSSSSSSSSSERKSPAFLQLKRIASLPGFDGGSDESSSGGGDNKLMGEFELSNLSFGELESKRPLPPTPPGDSGVGVMGRAAPPYNQGGGSKKSVSPQQPLRSTLLDDIEYAFPHADRMFDGGQFDDGVSSKRREMQHRNRNLDYAELDLVPPTSDRVGVANRQVGVTTRQVGNVDYAEIRMDGLGVSKGAGLRGHDVKNEDYSRLIDLTTNTTPSQSKGGVASSKTLGGDRPIGLDPLYTVPDKTERGVASSRPPPTTTSRSTHVPIGSDPDYAVPTRHKGARSTTVGVVSSRQEPVGVAPTSRQPRAIGRPNERYTGGKKGLESHSTAKSHDTNIKSHDTTKSDVEVAAALRTLPNSVREKLEKAQNLFAQGEASTESDDTVAMMLYQQFSNILFQVLQDPTVKATPPLHQQIKTKRDEGLRRCQSLQKVTSSTTTRTTATTRTTTTRTTSTSRSSSGITSDQQGSCKRCGRKRNLDDELLCGPCQLRERINKK